MHCQAGNRGKQNCDKNEKNIADPRMISGLLAAQKGP